MTEPERIGHAILSRRTFLAGSALAGAAAFLAACNTGAGTTDAPSGAQPTGSEPAPTAPTETPFPETTELHWANWAAYIDLTTAPGPDGLEGTDDDEYVLPSPTLDAFAAKYGVTVDYADAKIEDNETFVASIRPQLQSGAPTGWDMVVLTDWMAAKIIKSGWAEKITSEGTPTAAKNVRDALKGMPWDPDFTYHYPWQSGAVGVGYNVASTGRELTSVGDLFDPAFKGKVTLLSEVRDTFPLTHLYLQAQGKASANPAEEMTGDDAQVVHDFLKPYVDSGHITAFTGNEYLQFFASGDTWASIVWSGDLASSGGPDDRFVYPVEGSMYFTDNLLIPKGAVNRLNAERMIDWVYDPERAAAIADFIFYISPVKGVEETIKAIDPDAATNPLLFPPADVVKKSHPEPDWDEATEKRVNDLYADLSGK